MTGLSFFPGLWVGLVRGELIQDHQDQMDLLVEQLVLDLLEVKKINRMMLDYYLYLILNYLYIHFNE